MSSTGPENRFIQSVHKHLPAAVYRMKNHNPYVGGIADCWYSGNVSDLWVEYKYQKLPARSSSIVSLIEGKKPALSKLQQEWLENRYVEGRSVGVIIGTPQGGIWLPGLSWQKSLTAEECRGLMLKRPALAELIADTVHLRPI